MIGILGIENLNEIFYRDSHNVEYHKKKKKILQFPQVLSCSEIAADFFLLRIRLQTVVAYNEHTTSFRTRMLKRGVLSQRTYPKLDVGDHSHSHTSSLFAPSSLSILDPKSRLVPTKDAQLITFFSRPEESNVHREDGEEVVRKWLHRQNVIILCFYAVHCRGLVTPSTKKANRLARRCDPADDVQVRQDDDERSAAIFWNIEHCDKGRTIFLLTLTTRPPKRCTAELGSDLKIVCDATEPRVAPGRASTRCPTSPNPLEWVNCKRSPLHASSKADMLGEIVVNEGERGAWKVVRERMLSALLEELATHI
ncbi:hypothetical protein ARMSODRAFT_982469 [Armillaria solidipes]|uniref:Uncharacterized protein n=1 Tax=Armillaria solidipes TaxID=1076256 RepID=A0A2H3BB26_9AGAR|nr:hypothetical protein ARMSODRAFT_982469 [Armillaria solidipes]